MLRKIEMSYNDSQKQLAISENQGDYKKNEHITFSVDLIGANKKAQAHYYGEKLEVNI